ncbi:MAG: maleylpyruvate isomerase family mycothiol-dependent enzyme [Streptosporangiaceae bacterium]
MTDAWGGIDGFRGRSPSEPQGCEWLDKGVENMSDDAELQPAVAAQFVALAELLSTASDAAWNTESLCDGWRVREVVAHMTMPVRYSDGEFMAELERCGYDFTRLSNEIAARDANVPSGQLVTGLRSEVLHHWTPPGGGFHGALNHVVIHGLDVTVPLGEARLAPDEVIRVVLDDLTEGGVHQHFGLDIEDRILQARDIDWTYGSGQALRGAAEALALALCGRRLPDGLLAGAPLRRKEPAQGV